ncbi:hypothetical protein [Nitrosomonas sp. Nm58]|uniref:hypothetical protein n=1 Tax=Nitrosomonas sp. Nm58 TaxID=200126 RepID=UPI00115F9E95|nr:hypothetical protein [Nitrosomonas sp. Nm58]
MHQPLRATRGRDHQTDVCWSLPFLPSEDGAVNISRTDFVGQTRGTLGLFFLWEQAQGGRAVWKLAGRSLLED